MSHSDKQAPYTLFMPRSLSKDPTYVTWRKKRAAHCVCLVFKQTDELGFKIRDLNRPETKRGILSSICSLDDPLCFAAPETITASTLIKGTWNT